MPKRTPVLPQLSPLAFKDNFGERQIAAVRDAQRNIFHAHALSNLPRDASQPQRWLAARLANHFDVPPAHPTPPTGSQRFHSRFFRGEAPGVSFEFILVALAVRNFTRRVQ